MSEFSKLAEEKSLNKARLRPNALQIAWALVIIVFGGTLLWLTVTGEPTNPPVKKGQTASVAVIRPKLPENPVRTATSTTPELDAKPAAGTPPAAHSVVASLPLAAPDKGLITAGKYGPLPVIGTDGRQAWQVYAHPFEAASSRPRIAIVINNLGLSSKTTALAIEKLPENVTLGFSPYGATLDTWADKARKAFHETLIMIPMEPLSYPQDDPGPKTLLTSETAEENVDRLRWALSRFTGYVGIVNNMGSKFTASEKDMAPVIAEVARRGIMVLDASDSRFTVAAKLARNAGVPRAVNNRFIDNDLTAEQIDQRLGELEALAKGYGVAVGIGYAYPLTIERVQEWAKGLAARGFDLVPLTAAANRQAIN